MIQLTEKQISIILPKIQHVAEAREALRVAEQEAMDMITLAYPEWDPTVHTCKDGQITSKDESAQPKLVKES